MHPLLDNIRFIKAQQLDGRDTFGASAWSLLDVFPLPDDMQIYASSSFVHVTCVALNATDAKRLEENAPTAPVTKVAHWLLETVTGRAYLTASVRTGPKSISCVWINLYRTRPTRQGFEEMMGCIQKLCEDGAEVFILCVDAQLAEQHARSRLVVIDKDANMLMQYHRQPVNGLGVDEVMSACEASGLIVTGTADGEDMMRIHQVNSLPYDLWTSQTFRLIRCRARSHFLTYVGT